MCASILATPHKTRHVGLLDTPTQHDIYIYSGVYIKVAQSRSEVNAHAPLSAKAAARDQSRHPRRTVRCSSTGAVLYGAVLHGAVLYGAVLYGAVLYGAVLHSPQERRSH